MATDIKILRKRAVTLYKGHWKTLCFSSFIAILPTCIVAIVDTMFITQPTVLQPLLLFFFSVLFYPVATLGLSYMCLETWEEKRPNLRMLFHYCTSKGSILSTLLVGFLYTLLIHLSTIIDGICVSLKNNYTGLFILVLLSFVFRVLSIFFVVKLVLVPYIYARESFAFRPILLMKASARRIKGSVSRLIYLIITTSWWILLLPILLSIVAGVIAIQIQPASSVQNDVVLCAMLLTGLLLFSILSPFINLIFAGFASDFIQAGKK